ncbi:hypothetical protein JD844_014167 [Phrynosoma platyrhinos]|uniref:protein-tyrosine-phosphatase n=1 Tax=Phrynosoma platyrhinos TaxID=52577 RepID=A0ABQ7SRA9_PHRPL|nr:hypothetical protein JD844_014167 [Phrynosoma platyrhinos]
MLLLLCFHAGSFHYRFVCSLHPPGVSCFYASPGDSFPATKQFLEEINKWTVQYNVSPLSWNVAVKFLMARKFDVLRAIELFHSYRETRLKEGIVKLKPHEEPLRSELLSGKFTILSVRDPSGASIALFTAKLHHPNKSVQHVVLQALFYLLDRAVESTVIIESAVRVQMVKMSELKEHLPQECLPEYLGGSLKLDPISWNCSFLPQQNGHPDPLDELILVPLASPRDNGSVHVPVPKGMTVQEVLEHVKQKQKRGIYEEYEGIRRRRPLENTYNDFWRMVWEQNVLVIVMTTRLEEGGRRKCGQYWPLEKDFQSCYGTLTVTNLGVENLNHYKKTMLEIYNCESRERRLVTHFQYVSWPDYGVPSSAATLIDFLGAVKQQQRVAVSALGPRYKGHPGGPPIVVHCSAGIGRTGTFCALDICLSQLQDMGTLNVYQTVVRMRTQRAFSIQTPEQYYFCYMAIIEHAQRENLLPASRPWASLEKS